MSDILTIRGAQVVLRDRVARDATLLVEGGRIREIREKSPPRGELTGTVFDAEGRVVGPGFVDPHCHGDGIAKFFDDPNGVVSTLLRHGTTTVLATLGYPDMVNQGLSRQLREFVAACDPRSRAVVAGIHMEGPYVNRKYGAQTNRGVIKPFDPAEYRALVEEHGGLIKWWTCAPELAGAAEFIAHVTARGHVVGAGHSEASPEEIEAAVRAGLKVITHWTNATGNPRAADFAGTRSPGIDEAALVHDELSAEIIPDSAGRHVRPLMAKLLLKAKGPERVLVITDAGYRRPDDPTNQPPGLDVSIDATGNLAGSRLTMPAAARNFRAFTGCDLPALFRMAALNTARLLGLDSQLGSVAEGKWANLVVLDDDLQVMRTYWRGQEIPR